MSFDFNKNSRTLTFDYQATLNKLKYSGAYSLHNFSTEAKLFGSYASSTPTCQTDSLLTLDTWFQSENGTLARFDCFDRVENGRLVCGMYSWTAEVGSNQGLLLKSWRNTNTDLNPVWVRQPYVLNSAVPTQSNLTLTPGGKFTDTVGAPITMVRFSFRIVPELDSFSYTRNGSKVTIAEIPFLVIPVT